LEADKKRRPGYFILTGSQNFLVNKAITESLAGRVGILNLLPLSNHELFGNNLVSGSVNEVMFTGGYPRIFSDNILPTYRVLPILYFVIYSKGCWAINKSKKYGNFS
jgi:predicted AAA+ superfamily ATPase